MSDVADIQTELASLTSRIKSCEAKLKDLGARKKIAYNPNWREGYARPSDRYNYFAAKALYTGYKAELLYLHQLTQEATQALVDALGPLIDQVIDSPIPRD